jgi:hypothetical protein
MVNVGVTSSPALAPPMLGAPPPGAPPPSAPGDRAEREVFGAHLELRIVGKRDADGQPELGAVIRELCRRGQHADHRIRATIERDRLA